eukprot:Clim_evm52s109 gene=Clim_evmTU52s109
MPVPMDRITEVDPAVNTPVASGKRSVLAVTETKNAPVVSPGDQAVPTMSIALLDEAAARVAPADTEALATEAPTTTEKDVTSMYMELKSVAEHEQLVFAEPLSVPGASEDILLFDRMGSERLISYIKELHGIVETIRVFKARADADNQLLKNEIATFLEKDRKHTELLQLKTEEIDSLRQLSRESQETIASMTEELKRKDASSVATNDAHSRKVGELQTQLKAAKEENRRLVKSIESDKQKHHRTFKQIAGRSFDLRARYDTTTINVIAMYESILDDRSRACNCGIAGRDGPVPQAAASTKDTPAKYHGLREENEILKAKLKALPSLATWRRVQEEVQTLRQQTKSESSFAVGLDSVAGTPVKGAKLTSSRGKISATPRSSNMKNVSGTPKMKIQPSPVVKDTNYRLRLYQLESVGKDVLVNGFKEIAAATGHRGEVPEIVEAVQRLQTEHDRLTKQSLEVDAFVKGLGYNAPLADTLDWAKKIVQNMPGLKEQVRTLEAFHSEVKCALQAHVDQSSKLMSNDGIIQCLKDAIRATSLEREDSAVKAKVTQTVLERKTEHHAYHILATVMDLLKVKDINGLPAAVNSTINNVQEGRNFLRHVAAEVGLETNAKPLEILEAIEFMKSQPRIEAELLALETSLDNGEKMQSKDSGVKAPSCHKGTQSDDDDVCPSCATLADELEHAYGYVDEMREHLQAYHNSFTSIDQVLKHLRLLLGVKNASEIAPMVQRLMSDKSEIERMLGISALPPPLLSQEDLESLEV